MTNHGSTLYRHDRRRISYAQNCEDILIDRLFQGEVGTFMDIGACHPILDSNTWFFYERGWRGVNLEPSSSSFGLFLDQRPEDLNLNLAASDFDGELTLYEVDDHVINGTSTLAAEVAQDYLRRGLQVVEKKVPVRTVRGLVREHDIAPPDFLSIDVESHESQVIRSIDLEHWRPKLIVMEATVPGSSEPNHQSWEPMLLENRYCFVAFNGLNRFYLRDDLQHLARHFETPVNVFDRFLPYAQVRAESDAAEANRELGLARGKLERWERRQCEWEKERERTRLERQEESSRLRRLQIASSRLARREASLLHLCRQREAQRDELGAKLDCLLEEMEVLRLELAMLRLEREDRHDLTLAATG
jgi:FkbM family methyltransferase